MNIYDIILIIVLAVVIGYALKQTIDGFRGKNKILTCGGDCSHCNSSCKKVNKG